MIGYNKTIVMGNMTKDPYFSEGKNGVAFAFFGVAINEKFKDKETVTFIDVKTFGKTAESVNKYLTKGSPVLVEGKLRQDTYKEQKKIVIYADSVQFLGGKNKQPKPQPESNDEDIPW